MKKFILFISLMFFISTSIKAQDDWFAVQDENESEVVTIHRNHIGLFLGAISNLKNGEISFASGFDYTYHFADLYPVIGIGGFVEGGFGKHTEAIFGGVVSIKPWEEVQFHIAPAILYQDLHSTEIDNIHSTSKVKFLLRFGGNYSFHINNFSISPTLNADVVGSKVSLVYGIGFGIGL